MTALELSYYILSMERKSINNGITPLKMQKLLYYIYVWSLIENNKIIDDNFEKWPLGPVNGEVYRKYKVFGKKEIRIDNLNVPELSSEAEVFIDFILSNYNKYDATTLSAMTHKDIPWQKAEMNCPIDQKEIIDFYSKLNFAKNFPLNNLNKYYPVDTDLHYSYILDMNKKGNKNPVYYNSYKEYLDFEKKNKKGFEEGIKNWYGK